MGVEHVGGRSTYARKLENLSGEILKDCSHVDSGLGPDAHLVLGVVLEETLDTTAWELQIMMLVMLLSICAPCRWS